MIDVYEINHIRTAEMKSNEEFPRSETQFMQLRKKSEKKIQDFKGVWYRCDALTNRAKKPLMLGVGQLCVHIFP